jgi:iron(III) transport system substrate-binding protein
MAPVVVALVALACSPPRPPGAAGGPAQPAGGGGAPAATNPADPLVAGKTLSLEELHQRAVGEGGTLVFYSSLAAQNAEKILPAFERRFPGITVEHAGGPANRLVSRIVAEARGGKTIADVFSSNMEYVHQLNQQGLAHQDVPPEALAYPEDLRGRYWVAVDVIYIVPAWNTSQVSGEEVPREFDDLAQPKWRNRLIADPRDYELFMGLQRKHRSEEQATKLLQQYAANNPEFHNGHVELAELLVAGQGAVCLTCYAHHFPERMRRGAPVDYLRTEGIGVLNGTVILKGAPHPYAAMLWQRWIHSPEGQQAYAEGGRTPALPGVQARDNVRPERVYALGPEDVADTAKYERVWKEMFQLRG